MLGADNSRSIVVFSRRKKGNMGKGSLKKIEDIEAWQKARELAIAVWEASIQGGFAKDFKLRDQINEAAGSAMDNIAEGFGRGGNKEFASFLAIARGSAQEVKSQLYSAYDRKHLDELSFQRLLELSVQTIISVHTLFTMVNGSSFEGSKYHHRRKHEDGSTPPESR
jgi:four helix bundle protein